MPSNFPFNQNSDILNQILKYKTISIIGLGKNVGKTTTLNYIIELLRSTQQFALTSIGRDGEKYDEIFNNPKPQIFVPEGTILAIARKSLENMDISPEILATTDIYTPLGKIVIIRSLSAGYVELTGPSSSHELENVFELFRFYGAEIILVDGAINRKSFASPTITNATILATGASLSPNFNDIVNETEFAYEILTTPYFKDEAILTLISQIQKFGIITYEKEVISFSVSTSLDLHSSILQKIPSNSHYIVIKGVFSNILLEKLFLILSPQKKIIILVPDSTKIFLDREHFNLLKKTSWTLQVLKPIKLICITVNPYSPLGYHFESTLLQQELRRHIKIPIIDVLNGD
ncbi:lysine 5,6-aminomutase reactivase subunit KamB [Candidatus Harpocratesius sp.]